MQIFSTPGKNNLGATAPQHTGVLGKVALQ
jgi:hypothetical protein